MNRFFIISLVAIMLVQSFSKVLIVIDYQANKDYIMEFLCINRDKPQLKCEGKCHLAKKLRQQHETERQANKHSQKNEVQLTLICQSLFSLDAMPHSMLLTHAATYVSGKLKHALHSIFHPPQRIA